MGGRIELPSIPVIAVALAVLAGIGYLALRPQERSEPARTPDQIALANALAHTLQTGGPYTAVVQFNSATLGLITHRYVGTTEPGTSETSVTDQRAVLVNLDSVGPVQRLGSETVDGVATTHFHGVVDADLAMAHAQARLDAAGGAGAADITKIEDRPTEIDVWIDQGNFVRRFVTSESYSDGTLQASTDLTMSPAAR